MIMHTHSLISAFVIHLLESIISKLATTKFSIYFLVSVAEETGLSPVLSKPHRQVLSHRGPVVNICKKQVSKPRKCHNHR